MKKFLNKIFSILEDATRENLQDKPCSKCKLHKNSLDDFESEYKAHESKQDVTQSSNEDQIEPNEFKAFSANYWTIEDFYDNPPECFTNSFGYFKKLRELNDPSFRKVPCFFCGQDSMYGSNGLGFHLFGTILKISGEYYAIVVGGCAGPYPCRESAYSIGDDKKEYFRGVTPRGIINIMYNQRDNTFTSLETARKWIEQFKEYTAEEWCGNSVNLYLKYN